MYRGKPSDFNFSAIKYGHTINIITSLIQPYPYTGKKLSRAQTNSKGNSQSKFEREKGLLTLQILAGTKTNQFFSGPCFRNQCQYSFSFDSVIFSQKRFRSLHGSENKQVQTCTALSIVQRQRNCTCLVMNNLNTLSAADI